MTMADRLAVMNQGRIVQLGTPEEVYEAPNSRFAAEFIGSTNVFKATLREEGGTELDSTELERPLRLPHPLNARAGHGVTLSVRPERITLALPESAEALRDTEAANMAWGTVEQIGYMGSYSLFYVRLPAGRILEVNVPRGVLTAMPRSPDYGDTVVLRWSPRSLCLLG